MSYFKGFDPYFPDDDDDDDDEPPRNAECKHCGQAGLHWEECCGRWVLYTAKGAKHVCDQKWVDKMNGALFEDLTR